MLKANNESPKEEGKEQHGSSPFGESSSCLSLALANLFSVYPEDQHQRQYETLSHLAADYCSNYNRGLDPIHDFMNMANNFNESIHKMNGLEHILSFDSYNPIEVSTGQENKGSQDRRGDKYGQMTFSYADPNDSYSTDSENLPLHVDPKDILTPELYELFSGKKISLPSGSSRKVRSRERSRPIHKPRHTPPPLSTQVSSAQSTTKPQISYAALITEALQSSPSGLLTLAEIYACIKARYPYYDRADVAWQNSIRHNLSLNPVFVKVPRPVDIPGKGGYWGLDDEVLKQVEAEKILVEESKATPSGKRRRSSGGGKRQAPDEVSSQKSLEFLNDILSPLTQYEALPHLSEIPEEPLGEERFETNASAKKPKKRRSLSFKKRVILNHPPATELNPHPRSGSSSNIGGLKQLQYHHYQPTMELEF